MTNVKVLLCNLDISEYNKYKKKLITDVVDYVSLLFAAIVKAKTKFSKENFKYTHYNYYND